MYGALALHRALCRTLRSIDWGAFSALTVMPRGTALWQFKARQKSNKTEDIVESLWKACIFSQRHFLCVLIVVICSGDKKKWLPIPECPLCARLCSNCFTTLSCWILTGSRWGKCEGIPIAMPEITVAGYQTLTQRGQPQPIVPCHYHHTVQGCFLWRLTHFLCRHLQSSPKVLRLKNSSG